MGLGAIFGGLVTASLKKTSTRVLVWAAILFGSSTLALALMPTFAATMAVIVVVGAFSVFFISLGNTTLQLESAPELRGRVMAFYTMAFLGSTAIGGPIIGWIGEYAGPRWSLAVGGLAALVAVPLGIMIFRNGKSRPVPESVAITAEYAADEDRRVL